jgi:hypothetical protein
MTDAPPGALGKNWERGPVPLGDVLDRIVEVLGTVPPLVREKISGAMQEAGFEIILTTGRNKKTRDYGATIAMTIPTKDAIPLALMPVLLVIGYPEVPPSSITPLAWDRMRAFWEFGNAPVRGELAWRSTKVEAAG